MLTRPEAVLFDLDGTLADTAPDLAFALNATLRHFDRPPLPFSRIRPVVSHGGIALIRLGFGLQPGAAGFEERRQYLLEVYLDNLCRETRLFPGMEQLLALLEARDIRWGIVTNKPAWLTDPLAVQLGLHRRTPCIVSGDTCPNRKPHPEPLQHACRLLQVEPARTWYVGDAGRDMQAGRAAGCDTVGALYGYIAPNDPPEDWDCDHRVNAVQELIPLVEGSSGGV